MDIFTEQLVKKSKTAKDRTLAAVFVALFILIPATFIVLTRFSLYFGFLAFASVVAGVYALWYFITSLNLEYEYTVTNNNLTVDKVIAKRKRKRMLSLDIKKIERLEKFAGSELAKKPFDKVISAQDKEGSGNIYAATFYLEKYGKCMLLFAPNEKVLTAMKPFLKREIITKLFYNKAGEQ